MKESGHKLRERRLDRTDGIKGLENSEIRIKANNIQTYKKTIRNTRKKCLQKSRYKCEETKR